MPLNYLNSGDENIYAAGNLGNSFGQATLNLRKLQSMRELEAQRLMIENSYLQLAREKAKGESAKSALDMDMKRKEMSMMDRGNEGQMRSGRLAAAAKSPMLMQMVQDPVNGPQLMGDLRAAGAVPQGQFQITPDMLLHAIAAARTGQLTDIASSQPQVAGRMLDPIQRRMDEELRDPMVPQELIASASMTPYQQVQTEQGRQGLQIDQQRANDYGIAQKAMAQLHDEQRMHPERFRREDPLAAAFGGQDLVPPSGGKIITDKQGRQWRYKGNMADPTADKNEASWELVQ